MANDDRDILELLKGDLISSFPEDLSADYDEQHFELTDGFQRLARQGYALSNSR